MSNTRQDIFSMTTHYTCEHVRDHAHIRMPIITATDDESLEVTVSNLITQFSLRSILVGITSDGGTNLERLKDIYKVLLTTMGCLTW